MPHPDFWKRKYAEDTTLDRAKKRAKSNPALQKVIEVLYFDEQATDEEVAQAVSMGSNVEVDASQVKLLYRPQALRLIAQERAKVAPTAQEDRPRLAAPKGDGPIDAEAVELEDDSIDAMEAEAVRAVKKAQSGMGLHGWLNKVNIEVFKVAAPYAVLCLTIPESIYVFVHIYTSPNDVLVILTGLFAVLVDFGYLYLTSLLSSNKEAIFRRQRANIEVERHEHRAVRLQSWLWWLVALMDTVAQVVFLYGATKGSTFFSQRIVMVLVAIRVISLFTTMFVLSFAGTELLTRIDKTANDHLERAHQVGRLLTAMGSARLKRQEAKGQLARSVELQNLQRDGDKLLAEIYADARDAIRKNHLPPQSPPPPQRKP